VRAPGLRFVVSNPRGWSTPRQASWAHDVDANAVCWGHGQLWPAPDTVVMRGWYVCKGLRFLPVRILRPRVDALCGVEYSPLAGGYHVCGPVGWLVVIGRTLTVSASCPLKVKLHSCDYSCRLAVRLIAWMEFDFNTVQHSLHPFPRWAQFAANKNTHPVIFEYEADLNGLDLAARQFFIPLFPSYFYGVFQSSL
jgi:hypothetical protein